MLKLVQTCRNQFLGQHDVFSGRGRRVGYLRLRYGHFTADYPNHNGKCVYEGHPKDEGQFEEQERDFFLGRAVAELHKAAGMRGSGYIIEMEESQ